MYFIDCRYVLIQIKYYLFYSKLTCSFTLHMSRLCYSIFSLSQDMWFHSPNGYYSDKRGLSLHVGNSTVDCGYLSFEYNPGLTGFTSFQVANDLQVNIKVSLTSVYSPHVVAYMGIKKNVVGLNIIIVNSQGFCTSACKTHNLQTSHTLCFSEKGRYAEFEYEWGDCDGSTWRSAVSVCSGEDWVLFCYL